jgi:hypothetical protein
MIENLISFASLALAALFACAWLLSPTLRAWLERPKHRFQHSVQRYDREVGRKA